MVKMGTGKLNGLSVVKYRSTKAFATKQLMLRKTEKTPGSNPMIVDTQSTDDFHLPEGAGIGLCKLYGIPQVPGIPIDVISTDLNMNADAFLKSAKAIKIKTSSADFILPSAYKRVKNIEETSTSTMDADTMQLFGK